MKLINPKTKNPPKFEFPWHLTYTINVEKVALLPFPVNGTEYVVYLAKMPVIPTTALPAERINYH